MSLSNAMRGSLAVAPSLESAVIRGASTSTCCAHLRPNRRIQQVYKRRSLQTSSALREQPQDKPTAGQKASAKQRGQTKLFGSADEAIKDIKSGITLLSAGFGLSGVAATLIKAIAGRKDIQDITGVSNNAGAGADGGLNPLVKSGQLTRVIMSFLGGNKELESRYLNGKIAVELCPQGTLAERIRAAGAGIPAFYTPTGVSTAIQFGEIPIKYGEKDASGKAAIIEPGRKRETKVFDGKTYNMETAIKGDVAILRANKVDKAGNCIFRGTTKAFGIPMAKAATLTIVEADEIVEIGALNPSDVHLPGIYVDRIVQSTMPKEIEILTTKQNMKPSEDAGPAAARRNRIAKRASKELKNGYYVNLGIGMPTLAADYLDPSIQVWIQSENGLLGMGPYPTEKEADPDFINAGKETVTTLPGASIFDSSESFAMIRGGHVDVSMLGALEVDASGNLANYMIPGKLVKGMGGAMDLVSNPEGTRIVVLTDHVDKNGRPKILQQCKLPLTGAKVVSRIITDLAVFDVDLENGGLTLIETAPEVSVEEIKEKTGAGFKVADNLGKME